MKGDYTVTRFDIFLLYSMFSQIKEEECFLSTTYVQLTDACPRDAVSRALRPVFNLSSRRLQGLRHSKTNPKIVQECGVKPGLYTLVDFLLVVFSEKRQASSKNAWTATCLRGFMFVSLPNLHLVGRCCVQALVKRQRVKRDGLVKSTVLEANQEENIRRKNSLTLFLLSLFPRGDSVHICCAALMKSAPFWNK